MPVHDPKELFIEYYRKMPMIKYAAKHAGIHRATAHRWLDEDDKDNYDATFATRVGEAEASFVAKQMARVKPEFPLERIFKDDFAQRTELTGEGGKDLTFKVVNYGDNTPT